jgi:hypothetical protein
MNRFRALAALFTGGLLAASLGAPGSAHHAFTSDYDCKAPVRLTGSVTMIEWVNPHVWVHLRVVAPGRAPMDWMFEGTTPATLERLGVSRASLKVGDEITVRGHQSKDRRCVEHAVTRVATCRAVGGPLVLASGALTSLGEDVQVLNNSAFNSRPFATPEQLLAQLGESCGPRPKQGRGDD